MAASVVMKASMVAMFGAIMPEPLAMAPSRAVLPSSVNSTATCLGNVSVVMMAWAASSQSSPCSLPAAFWMPATIFSIGSAVPMTPVLARQHAPVRQAQRLGGVVDHRDGVGPALLAVAGVGVAGVDDDGAGEAVLQVRLVADDAGRFDDVGGEDARRHRVHFGDDQARGRCACA